MITVDMAKASRQDVTLGTPVCGLMTTISTASALIKAGGSVLAGRRTLHVRNTSSSVAVRIGPSGMTARSGGFLLEPLASMEWTFDPAVGVDIFARSTGRSVELEIMESV